MTQAENFPPSESGHASANTDTNADLGEAQKRPRRITRPRGPHAHSTDSAEPSEPADSVPDDDDDEAPASPRAPSVSTPTLSPASTSASAVSLPDPLREGFTPADPAERTLLQIKDDAAFAPSRDERTLMQLKDGVAYHAPTQTATLFGTGPIPMPADSQQNPPPTSGPRSGAMGGASKREPSVAITWADLQAALGDLPAMLTPPLDSRTVLRVRPPAHPDSHETSHIETIQTVLAVAREGQKIWEAVPLRERVRIVDKIRFRLFSRRLEIVNTFDRQTAQTEFETLAVELLGSCDLIREYARLAPELLAPQIRWTDPILFRGRRIEMWRAPWGVVGLIASSPHAVAEIARTIAAALIGGNAVIVAPTIGGDLFELIREIFAPEPLGLPAGTVYFMPPDPQSRIALAGAAVDHLIVSGSADPVRNELEVRAQALAGATVHLHGAPSAMVVFDDADLPAAAKAAATSAFRLVGTAAESVGRVYVDASVADTFAEYAAKAAFDTKLGKLAGGFEVGPLADTNALDQAEKIIADAIAEGAELKAGGRRLHLVRAPYMHPTVLAGCTDQMRVVWEHRAPILAIVPIPGEWLSTHVPMVLNCVPVPAVSIWSADGIRAKRLARSLHAGFVAINDEPRPFLDPRLPLPATRGLGYGSIYGPEALLDMTRPVAVSVDDGSLRYKPFWFPYDHDKLDLARTLLRLRHSEKWLDRASAWIRLLFHPNLRRLLRGDPLGEPSPGWLGLGLFSADWFRIGPFARRRESADKPTFDTPTSPPPISPKPPEPTADAEPSGADASGGAASDEGEAAERRS